MPSRRCSSVTTTWSARRGAASYAKPAWPSEDGLDREVVTVTQAGECELALRTGAPVIVEDVATETRFATPAIVVASGVRSSLCVAIEGRDRPFGTIDVHAAEPRRFGDADARSLQAVANVLAFAGRRELDERARLARSLVLGSLTAREREVLRLLERVRTTGRSRRCSASSTRPSEVTSVPSSRSSAFARSSRRSPGRTRSACSRTTEPSGACLRYLNKP